MFIVPGDILIALLLLLLNGCIIRGGGRFHSF